MLLRRTDKARAELSPGNRTLTLRERSLILLADGSKSLADFNVMFDGEGLSLTQRLVSQGYLELASAPARPAAPKPLAATAAPQRPPVAAEAAPVPKVAADSFDGKRSLATTRMFLFDICERMFARRDPILHVRFRDSLREARDRQAMVDVSREMITEIERVAGSERADSLSERIAMLLPPEVAA